MKKQIIIDFNEDKKGATVTLIDPRKIAVDPDFNRREDYGNMDELCDSIIVNGILQPLIVRKDENGYTLRSGHRRLRAVNMAADKGKEFSRIPCIVQLSKSIVQDLFEMVLYNRGKEFSALEDGAVYNELFLRGVTKKEIAETVGITVTKVDDLIMLYNMPADGKELIKSGKISVTNAISSLKGVHSQDDAVTHMSNAVDLAEKEGKTKATARHLKTDGLKGGMIDFLYELLSRLHQNGVNNIKVEMLVKLIPILKNQRFPTLIEEIDYSEAMEFFVNETIPTN